MAVAACDADRSHTVLAACEGLGALGTQRRRQECATIGSGRLHIESDGPTSSRRDRPQGWRDGRRSGAAMPETNLCDSQ
jgi:hypothetical protein